jgi:putative transposase
MSRKYKFLNPEGLYFVSFAKVNWVDVFTREEHFDIVVESLDFNRKSKGLEIFAWCIMTNHVHLLMRCLQDSPEIVLGKFKEYTSRALVQAITDNPLESRKCWLIEMFQNAAAKTSNVSSLQLWQHHNQPVEVWSNHIIDQKIDYIHENPVKAGFVQEPWHWRYSSAIDYCGGKGVLEIDYIE